MSRECADVRDPWAAVRTRPLEHFEMTILGRHVTDLRVPRAAIGRRRPPAPNNMMLHRGGGGLGLTLCPFLVPCTKCIQNVNVNVKVGTRSMSSAMAGH